MRKLASLAAAAILFPSAAFATDLFVISGTSNGTPITPVGANNLIDLVNSAVNNQGEFAALANTNASLSLSYGGIANAISIDKNPANTFATLSFINKDGSRTTRTFDTTAPGANGRSLQKLIEDYLKKDGAGDLKSFMQAIDARSVVGVSDGNPNAGTARMADAVYSRFGRFQRQTAMAVSTAPTDPNDPSTAGQAAPDFQLRFGVGAYTFDSDGFSGQSVGLTSSADWNFTPRVGLTLGSYLAYNSVESADVYHVGIYLGVPVRPVLGTPTQPWTWEVTPSAAVGASGSWQELSGGIMYGFAGTSLLRYQATPKLAFELSDQIGYYTGTSVGVGSLRIDPGVDQWILKNGLEAQYMVGERGWYLYGGASYTNFLNEAAIKDYITPSAGIGWQKSPNGTNVEIGFLGDFGDGYTGYGGRVSVNIAF
jgi:hypothetical protein